VKVHDNWLGANIGFIQEARAMKIWQLTGVAIAALLLGSCGPTSEGSWQWFSVGTARRDFGGFRFAQNGTPLYFSFAEGNARFDEKLDDWVSVEAPGGRGAVYDVARDGTEFVTSYGIYTRPSSTAAWTLIPGSRALGLQYLGLDRDGSLYGVVGSFSTQLPAGSNRVYAKLQGSSTWTAVSGLPSSDVVASAGIDPIGRAYILTIKIGSTAMLGSQFQGSSAVAMPQPQANIYDYAGNRYVSSGATIQKVTPSGTLETWLNLSDKQSPSLSKFLWFGKDGRVYAIAGFNSMLGSDIKAGDILAISPNDTKWSKVASSVLDGEGRRTGPGLPIDAYNISFAPDGSLYFYACESGCAGSGNAFSYGIYRLKF
jgi:hypothetical protein